MIWIVLGMLAALRLPAGAVAFIAPALILTWYAVSGSTLSAVAAWLAAAWMLALLWKSDRG